MGQRSRRGHTATTGATTCGGSVKHGSEPRSFPVGAPARVTDAPCSKHSKEAAVSTILIGVDASARSEDAVAAGRRLALAGDSTIIVATVTPADSPYRDEARAVVRRMSGLLVGIDPAHIRTAVISGRSAAEALHLL